MNDIKITVSGWVGTDPTVREVNGGESLVTSFRLANTPRVRDRNTNLWRDQATSWFQVSCWRQLGVNVVESVGKGQRVVVHGRLAIREWTTPEGQPRTRAEIEADSVGFDLGFGRGTFEKVNWSQPRPMVGERDLDELAELAELQTRGLDVEALLGVREPARQSDGDTNDDTNDDSYGDPDCEDSGTGLRSLGELVGQH